MYRELKQIQTETPFWDRNGGGELFGCQYQYVSFRTAKQEKRKCPFALLHNFFFSFYQIPARIRHQLEYCNTLYSILARFVSFEVG